MGDGRTRPVAQKNEFGIGGNLGSVPVLQKGNYVVPKNPGALAVGVGPASVPPEAGLDVAGPLNGVRWKHGFGAGVVDPHRVREVHQGRDLPGPCQWLLSDRLGIPNVGVNNFVKAKVVVVGIAIPEGLGNLVCGNHDGSPDGVFHLEEVGVDGFFREPFLVRRWGGGSS